MRLIILLPFMTVVLVGCTNNLVGGVDQIFGRTKVAPPATGSASAVDPAYTTRGLASTALPPAAIGATAPGATVNSPVYSSIPAVAKAPEVPTVRTQTAAAVPSYNSSVPLNVAPPAAVSPAAPIVPINTPNPNPVTVSSTTTFNTSGSTYVVAGEPNTASANAQSLTDAFTSSSGSGPLDSNPYGPGPKMTRTRVAPMSLADNRARTYGQLGQVTVDQNPAPGGIATPTATATTVTPGGSAARSQTWAAPTSSGQNQSGGVIDIMDLPPKGSGTSGPGSNNQQPRGTFGASTTIHRDPAVQQASAVMPLETPAGGQTANPYSPQQLPEFRKPVTPGSATNYACAGDRSWLKGRLEYSQARQRWKLRYISLDGEADRFGGSVVLQNSSLLSGCNPGDFVEVNGRITGESKTPGDFAPDYEISQLKRVER